MTTHSLSVDVTWANARSPLLERTTVQLFEGASTTPLQARGPVGNRRHVVPNFAADIELRLVVTVLPPEERRPRRAPRNWQPSQPAFAGPLVHFEQRLRVVRGAAANAAPTLQWLGATDPVGADRFANQPHPRISAHAVRAGSQTVHLEVDLRFIDVTAMYEIVRQDGGMRQLFEDALSSEQTTRFDADWFGGCKLRLLAFAGAPAIWPVLIPPSFTPTDTTFGCTVFYTPAGQSYSSVRNVNLFSFSRYTLRANGGREWQHGPELHDDYRFYVRYRFEGDSLHFTHHIWERLDFGGQLARSGKKTLLVMPVPTGASFGAAAGDHLKTRLGSLLVALRENGHIARDVPGSTTPSVGRLAIGGFSLGGGAAFDAFHNNEATTNELYLFDPNEFDANVAAVRSWWAANRSARVVRMIGGRLRHSSMLSARRTFDDPPPSTLTMCVPAHPGTATVWPRNRQFWTHSRVYAKAFAVGSVRAATADQLAEPIPVAAEQLDVLDESVLPTGRAARLPGATNHIVATPGSLSDRTGVFRVRRTGQPADTTRLNLIAKAPNDSLTRIHGIDGANESEFCLVMLVGLREVESVTRDVHVRVQFPIQTDAALGRLVSDYVEFLGSRHQWAVQGGATIGDGEADDPTSITGYLELCFRTSQFP